MRVNHNIRIAISGGPRLFRECVCATLKNEGSMEIVGDAENGVQAIDIIKTLKPEVVLLDITMPASNGTQVLAAIKSQSLGTKALIFSDALDEGQIANCIKAGARGYLSRQSNIADLIMAIKAVYEGQLWIGRKLTARLLNGGFHNVTADDDRKKKTKDSLTTREKEVFSLLSEGLTNKQIAQALFISEKTVKSHLNSIFKKLNVRRRFEAIVIAIKRSIYNDSKIDYPH